jgi:hypothetical protein
MALQNFGIPVGTGIRADLMTTAFAAFDVVGQRALAHDLVALVDPFNRSGDDTMADTDGERLRGRVG